MRRYILLIGLMSIFLIVSGAVASSMEDNTLILPSSLVCVKEAAFAGTAAEKVIVPEGTKEIRNRAFAGSSLTQAVLPFSLTYIADDAFDGCPEGLKISAEKDSYAYCWAVEKGFIGGPLEKLIIELPLSNPYEIDIAKPFQIPYSTIPSDTFEKIKWESHDPESGTVDANGLVTPLKTGYLYIRAFRENGEYLGSVNLLVTGDFYQTDCLQYALTSDGTGYRIVGCTGDPGRVSIPAFHEGLPVVGFEPGAFKDCTRMTDIALEDGHTTLYLENASLYANLPQKTLLYHPGYHFARKHYQVAHGTKAIAAYAFANSYLSDLTIPEGVVSIGDYAFYKLPWSISIYMPDSLSDFGKFLFQGQKASAAFYANDWDSPAAVYAEKNNIPCGVIVQRTPEPTPAPTPTPVPTPTPFIPELDESNIVIFNQLDYPYYKEHYIKCFYDISGLEKEDVTEVRLAIKDQWRDMAYYPELAKQTGLYGTGYTDQEAVLRAYDQNDRLIGSKRISGSFYFSFDGARTLGVSGGKGTSLIVVPTKPIIITSPGRYPVMPSQWHSTFDGDLYQHYIIAMPRAAWSSSFPYHLNIISGNLTSCKTGASVTSSEEYMLLSVHTNDGTRADQINLYTYIFDKLECLFNNDRLGVYASSLPEKSKNLGAKINEAFENTLSEMLSGHLPDSLSFGKVYVNIDGSYPLAVNGTIHLDNPFFIYDDGDACTFIHEFTHAIDQKLVGPQIEDILPTAWMEGRAEYVSRDVCSKQNYNYNSTDYVDGKDTDWSFISDEDRADFFRYYHESANRVSTYLIGYQFYDFLIDTYGKNVGSKIMYNIAATPYDASEGVEFFKKCVEAATETGVFQRFVDDVILPSGT